MGQPCSKKALKASEHPKLEFIAKKPSIMHRDRDKEKEHNNQKLSFKICLENLKAKHLSHVLLLIPFFFFSNDYEIFI